MAGIVVGSVEVRVVPDARGFISDLGGQITPDAEALGARIGGVISDRIAAGIRSGLREGLRDSPTGPARENGARTGGAFAEAFKARVRAAMQSLPKAELDADSTDADRKIADIRARLQALSAGEIGVDLSSKEALAKLKELRAELDELAKKSPDVRVRVDAARASAELKAMQDEIKRLDGKTAHVKIDDRGSGGALLTTILALSPALVTVGAVAVGALAGIVPTAAAAVLAILGIRDAWKSGALQGTAFAKQVGALQTEFGRLKTIAATNMLPGLTAAMASLQPLFGPLNSMVGVFSRQLGQIAAAVAPALVQILTQLQPLFVEIGNALVTGANHLALWAQNGKGLTGFVQYVQANLPVVLHTLGDLIQVFGHIAAAAAPLGPIILKSIGIIADLISAIPTPVLTGLITVIIAARLAFLGLRVAIMVANLAMEATPVGIVIALAAAVAAFAFGMGQQASSAEDAVQANADYAQSVKTSTDALNASNIAATNKTLTDQRAFALLDILHNSNQALSVSYKDLTLAVNGNDKQFQALTGTLRAQGPVGVLLANSLVAVRAQLHDNIDQETRLKVATKETTAAVASHAAAQRQNALALGVTASQYAAAVEAARKNKQQTDAQTLAFRLENDAASLLSQSLDKLNGWTLSSAEAQTALRQANLQVMQSIKDNGTVIQGSTAKAIANQQAFQAQARGAIAYAEAVGKATGSSKAEAIQLRNTRDGIEADLKARGKLTPQLKAYIDQLYNLKNLKVPPTKIDVEKTEADSKIKQFQSAINAIKQGKVPGLDVESRDGKNAVDGLQQAIDYMKQHHKPTVDAYTDGLLAKVRDAQRYLDSLHSKTVYVDVQQRILGDPIPKATGGLIVGPGTGTSDQAGIFALSNREFVSTAASVGRNLAALAAGNRGAQLVVAGSYAAGAAPDPVRPAVSYTGPSAAVIAPSSMTGRVATSPTGPALAQLSPQDRALMREFLTRTQTLTVDVQGAAVIGKISNDHRAERVLHGDPAYR